MVFFDEVTESKIYRDAIDKGELPPVEVRVSYETIQDLSIAAILVAVIVLLARKALTKA